MQRVATSRRSRVLPKLAIACAAASAMWMTSGALAALEFRTVALTGTDGEYGPGQGTGITFTSLTSVQPSINSAGQVAFRGQDSTAGNPNGLWLRTGSANAVIAINGGPQPGGGTYPAGAIFNSYQVNNAGEMAWRLAATSGAFATAGGSPGRFMLAGDSAPGTTTTLPLAVYAGISSGMPLFNQSGQLMAMASLTPDATLNPPVVTTAGSANSSGLWVGTPGNAQLVLRQNDALTSLDPSGNTRIGTMQSGGMLFNGNGRYALITSLQGSNVVTGTGATGNSTLIATNRGGSLEVVARHGQAAPDASGVPSANLYRTISNTALGFNDVGHIAFTSSLRDASGTQTATGALFSDAGTGMLRMISKQGDALPTIYSRTGTPLSEFAGVTWGLSYGSPVLTSNDQLLFAPTGMGNTGGTNNNGAIMLMDDAGQLQKIVRTGDVAIPGGAPNGSDAFFLGTTNYQINSLGQIAFMSSLTGVGVSPGLGNGSALWLSEVDGTLHRVARTSELFEVAPGDFRTVSAIGGLATSGGQDGRQINLSSNGMLAFQLDFSDGSGGVFTMMVPEPSSAALCGLVAVTLTARRRRNRQ